MRTSAAIAATILALASCTPVESDFECATDESCTSADGTRGYCQPWSRRCSFSDDSCASKRRYVDQAGALSNLCTAAPTCSASVQAGGRRTCARVTDGTGASSGTIECWGAGATTPVILEGDIDKVALGDGGICALHRSGEVHCAMGSVATMTRVGDFTASHIAVGSNHACAVTSGVDKRVVCWGSNARGQLGVCTTETVGPVEVPGLSSVREVAAGLEATCAITDTAVVYCWGLNDKDQLGRGISVDRDCDARPVEDLLAASTTVGDRFACALTAAGDVTCWGTNLQGQLGDSLADDSVGTPNPVRALFGVTQLRSGGSHTCALTSLGTRCWGNNQAHQCSNSPFTTHTSPRPVGYDRAESAVEIATGAQHTCGRSSDGGIWCWGGNTDGERGDGTLVAAEEPTSALLICPESRVP